MNINLILALFQAKGLLSRAECERIAEHVANRPQSTYFADAVREIAGLLDEPDEPILPSVKKLTDKPSK